MDILRGNKRFSTFLVFLGFFIFVCVLNWDARYEKPVWDTAAGVFSPAIYLYETGFDFYGLLEEPGFRQAGPNVHVYTPITIVTAAVMWLFNGDTESVNFWHLHFVVCDSCDHALSAFSDSIKIYVYGDRGKSMCHPRFLKLG